MIQSFSAVDGQSIFDVCLNCYGTLDLLYKLIQDSAVDNVNLVPQSRQVFQYDDSLVVDQNINQRFTLSGLKYATVAGPNGSVFYIINQRVPNRTIPPTGPTSPPPNMSTYQIVRSTSYTGGADGETIIYPLDSDGNSMAGNKYDIVQIEEEIMPFKATDFIWNKALGFLTITNPDRALVEGGTLYIIYSQTITS